MVDASALLARTVQVLVLLKDFEGLKLVDLECPKVGDFLVHLACFFYLLEV